MAIRTTNPGFTHQGLGRLYAHGLPPPYPLSAVWTIYVEDRQAAKYFTAFAYGPSPFSGTDYYTAAGVLGEWSCGVAGTDSTTGVQIAENRWWRQGFRTRIIGTTREHQFFYDLPATVSRSNNFAGAYFAAPSSTHFLRFADVEWSPDETLIGRIGGIKIWQAYLPAMVLAREAMSHDIVHPEYKPYLWAHIKARHVDDLHDWSGKGRRFYIPEMRPTTAADAPMLRPARRQIERADIASHHALLASTFAVAGGTVALAGTAAGQATPAGALSITAQLVAASLGISTPAGTLSVALNPAGAVLGAAVVAGALALEVPLAASAQAVAQTAGALGVVKPLAGVSAGLAAINGTLSVSSGAALDGAAAGAAQVVGALDLLKPLSGNSLGAAAVAGGLSLAIAFNGAALGQAFVQGALQIEGAVDLAGAAQGATTVQGALGKLAALSAAAGGEADARATLALTLNLSGTAGGQAAGAGTLLVQGGISGAVLVEAIASGTLTMAVNLSGAALAQALIAGSLADMQSFTISPRHVVRAPRRDWTAGARGREWRVAA